MAWHEGRYYYRTKKVGGKVVREYCGSGYAGELSARLDEVERERRKHAQASAKFEQDCINARDSTVNEFDDLANMLARVALMAAGYHQHHRSEWRKIRDRKEK